MGQRKEQIIQREIALELEIHYLEQLYLSDCWGLTLMSNIDFHITPLRRT
jgi:hypothetical protein